jgi:predicted DNA-binding transcriptional regulator YafY
LVDLVAALIDARQPLTRDQIRDRIPAYSEDEGAFKRAFERDKDALRQMNIPIAVEPLERDNPDSAVGYRIRREEYELQDPGLDADELAALHLASSAVKIAGVAGTEAIWKLGGAPAGAGGTAVAELPGSEHLGALFGAIAERRAVAFRYRDQERSLEPYFLSFRKGAWYVIGHDRTRDEDRTFRLDRFQSAPDVGPPDAFVRPDAARGLPQPWEMGDEDPVEARVRVDESHAGQVLARLGDDALDERLDGGGVVVTMRVTNRSAFRSFVVDLLEHAEVVSPPDLRDELVGWLGAIAGGARA